MSIAEKEQELIEEFSFFEDWMEKYEYIIDLGKELPPFQDEDKVDQYRISGCQSQLWIKIEKKDQNLFFSTDSDAIITKGIAALVLRPINGESSQVIANYNFDFINQIGLNEHLSMTRANGLASMISTIKATAKRHNS
ncbi:MAG: SufE family protein [Flavobacteriales bacterium]